MTAIVAPLSALLLVLGGLLICVSATRLGQKFLLGGIGLAFFGPLVDGALAAVGHVLHAVVPGLDLALTVAFVALAVVFAGVIRFVNHKRQAQAWLRASPTSKKTRVEP